jgi:chemotaxis protein MotB
MAKKERVIKDTAERWLLTYADLMNLLLIFFIILYAMSQTDSKKFEQLKDSFARVLGTYTKYDTYVKTSSNGGNSVTTMKYAAKTQAVVANSGEQKQMEKVKEKVEGIIKKQGLKGEVEVSLQQRGVVISITAQLLFLPASATIEASSKKIVLEIGNQVLAKLGGKKIKIEGHTDNDTLGRSSPFIDNWGLSAARATNVLRLLVDNVPALKAEEKKGNFSAAGYGQYNPKVPNTSAANKQRNRRVDIAILKDAYAPADASSDIAETTSQTTEASSHTTEDTSDTTETTDSSGH